MGNIGRAVKAVIIGGGLFYAGSQCGGSDEITYNNQDSASSGTATTIEGRQVYGDGTTSIVPADGKIPKITTSTLPEIDGAGSISIDQNGICEFTKATGENQPYVVASPIYIWSAQGDIFDGSYLEVGSVAYPAKGDTCIPAGLAESAMSYNSTEVEAEIVAQFSVFEGFAQATPVTEIAPTTAPTPTTVNIPAGKGTISIGPDGKCAVTLPTDGSRDFVVSGNKPIALVENSGSFEEFEVGDQVSAQQGDRCASSETAEANSQIQSSEKQSKIDAAIISFL